MIQKSDIEAWLRENARQIASSTAFVSVISENALADPLCALQLGMAIMQSKIIVLLVSDKIELPEKLKRVADVVEPVDFDDKESCKKVAKRLIEDFLKKHRT